MKKIYIAGALNADAVGYVQNIHTMIKYADKVRRKGYAVFVPCLDMLMGICFGDYTYYDYFDNNQEFLKVCDAMLVCPNSENSKGTQMEIEIARTYDIPVFYNVEEIFI